MRKQNFGWSWTAMIGIVLFGLISCEQEDRFVGSNVIDNQAQFHKAYVDLTATTINADTIRTDRSLLQSASVGVYDEPLFGKTKSSFVSHVRLGTTNPRFGSNAIVDSVILSIPVFTNTSDTLAIERYQLPTNYLLSNPADEECTVRDTIYRYQNRYLFAIDSIYGNRNASMNLQVHRVVQNLGTIDSLKFSNSNVQTAELFGSQQITSTAFKSITSQYTTVEAESDSTIYAQDPMSLIRIQLDGMKDFVQTQIVDQPGSPNIGDQVSFINNLLQGIKLSVEDENGFILTFNPSFLRLNAYISEDNPNFVDENGNGIHDEEESCPVSVTMPRTTNSLDFVIGSNVNASSGIQHYNVAHSEITNTMGSISFNQPNAPVNYIEGMAGSRVKISLNPEQVEAIRDSVRNNNWVISQANLKIYPHMSTQGNLPLPEYLYAFNLTKGKLIADYGDHENTDPDNLQIFPFLQISRAYDSNDQYYLLRITEYFKNIIEKNHEIDDLAIEMGNYLGYSTADYFYTPRNAFYSNRAFNPYRLAIVGSNPHGDVMDKKLQLEIFYNKRPTNY